MKQKDFKNVQKLIELKKEIEKAIDDLHKRITLHSFFDFQDEIIDYLLPLVRVFEETWYKNKIKEIDEELEKLGVEKE